MAAPPNIEEDGWRKLVSSSLGVLSTADTEGAGQHDGVVWLVAGDVGVEEQAGSERGEGRSSLWLVSEQAGGVVSRLLLVLRRLVALLTGIKGCWEREGAVEVVSPDMETEWGIGSHGCLPLRRERKRVEERDREKMGGGGG
ncbi:hypothetical protein FXO38_16150 [Capsicum annuum]|nr:hypothetical protein FXO38_16150 [Capsicum annuum]